MIHAQQLAKQFGAVNAVHDVTLEVGSGEILALLGPNGAGKTTTIRMLCSLLRPSSGRASVAGFDTVTEAAQVRNTVGLLTELPGLYGRMSAVGYLDFFGKLHGMSASDRQARSEHLLSYFGLWDDRGRHVGAFSKGMRQKLALARALLHEPKVIMLDEPTSAMDPASAKSVRDYIQGLRASDRTIIICTHNLAEAEALADRIAILRRGRIVAVGTARELKERLLGAAQFEVRFQAPAPPAAFVVDGLIQMEQFGPTWARYSTSRPGEANPALVRQLVEAGVAVESLSETPRSLEAVYLRIVGEELQ
ncbi:MAG: ABC transporter ATP-binding protein [Chloroflexi bacterium]|nr:ABC transporter ATP-binding protein [Chloroflexota bacterium]